MACEEARKRGSEVCDVCIFSGGEGGGGRGNEGSAARRRGRIDWRGGAGEDSRKGESGRRDVAAHGMLATSQNGTHVGNGQMPSTLDLDGR